MVDKKKNTSFFFSFAISYAQHWINGDDNEILSVFFINEKKFLIFNEEQRVSVEKMICQILI